MKTLLIFTLALSLTLLCSAENEIPLIGAKAPSFKANTTNGMLNFPKDFGNSWKILLSHPRDFTPVCTSEIKQLAEMQDEFKALNVKLAIVSTDDVTQHNSWKKSIEEITDVNGKNVKIGFPLIDDKEAKVSKKYGMLHKPASTTRDVRGVFVVCPDNIVQSISFYPMSTGRNMDEIKRLIIALQKTKSDNVLTPANWAQGDDVLMPFKPYSEDQLSTNPQLAHDYYNVGNTMWFKKTK